MANAPFFTASHWVSEQRDNYWYYGDIYRDRPDQYRAAIEA